MKFNKDNVIKYPILSKVTYKEDEPIYVGKRVSMSSTQSRFSAVDRHYKLICKY